MREFIARYVIFNKRYFSLTIILLVIEILIASFLKTGFIRHYVGDYLVVILIYCFVKSFYKIPVPYALFGVLGFAYFIELLQYLDFINWSGLENYRFAGIILGTYFEWADMLAYTLGIATIWFGEQIITREND